MIQEQGARKRDIEPDASPCGDRDEFGRIQLKEPEQHIPVHAGHPADASIKGIAETVIKESSQKTQALEYPKHSIRNQPGNPKLGYKKKRCNGIWAFSSSLSRLIHTVIVKDLYDIPDTYNMYIPVIFSHMLH